MNKKLSSNYIYSLLYQISSVAIQLVTVPHISRVLGAEGVGQVSYVSSFTSYFALFGLLGITVYGQLEMAKVRDDPDRSNHLFWELFLSKTITMMISITIYVSLILFAPIPYKPMFVALLPYLLGELISVTWYLQANENFKATALLTTIFKVLSTPLIFLLVRDQDDLYTYVLILYLTTVTANLLMWRHVIPNLKPIAWKKLNFNQHWKGSFAYFIPSAAALANLVLGKNLLGILSGDMSQNGYYEQAFKIEQILSAVVTSLSTVTLPRVTYLQGKARKNELEEIQRDSFRFVLMLSIPMTFGVIAVSDVLVPVFFGAGYRGSIPVLKLMSIMVVILGVDNVIGTQGLMSRGLYKQYNTCFLVGTATNLLMNLLLIPGMGATGAAIALLASEIVILCGFILCTKTYFPYKWVIGCALKYIAYGLLMFILIRSFTPLLPLNVIGLGIQILVGVVCYGIILMITKDPVVMAVLTKFKGK